MPPISIVSSTTSNFAFAGGEYVPEIYKFPANTLIPYYGNTPLISGWERYAAADGRYLYSTLTPAQIGAALAGTNGSVSASGSTPSAGVHSGSNFNQNITGSTGGSLGFLTGSADNHSHSFNAGTLNGATENILNRQRVTFLRTKSSVARIPSNALVVKQTTPANASAFIGAQSVASVTISGTWSGFTQVTSKVTFSAPEVPGGVTATGTVKITLGVPTSVTVTNKGSGYRSPPTVTITDTDADVETRGTATAVLTTDSKSYLVGALNNQTFTGGVPYSGGIGVTMSSNGGHIHMGTSTAYRPMANGAYLRNYNYQYAGAHGHSATLSLSQSTISSKLLNFWKMNLESRPQTDMIVMYVGTLGAIPAPWYVCDGNNGTLNLGSYVIGYGNNQWNVITSADNIGYLSLNTASVSHYHNSGYAYTPNTTGSGGQHNTVSWSHTHGPMVYSGAPFVPPRIGVAFIQYKGVIP